MPDDAFDQSTGSEILRLLAVICRYVYAGCYYAKITTGQIGRCDSPTTMIFLRFGSDSRTRHITAAVLLFIALLAFIALPACLTTFHSIAAKYFKFTNIPYYTGISSA